VDIIDNIMQAVRMSGQPTDQEENKAHKDKDMIEQVIISEQIANKL
jgi:hypothetical protein